MAHLARLLLIAAAGAACLQAQAETVGRAVFPEPQPSWFMMVGTDAGYIFDGADGEMQGLISHSAFTTAIVTQPERKEAYFVDSFYSRGVRGERSDVLTVVDLRDLTPVAEVALPPKAAALRIRGHIGLLDDQRHVIVFNMTPAQSVSVVDVVERRFAGEISTAGCGIIMPAGPRGFLMLCGDGTLQHLRLDERGLEAGRSRSKPFFDVEKDPVFDRVVHAGGDWILVTHDGLVRQVGVDGERIRVGEAWSMLNEDDRKDGSDREQWRPGGDQPFTMHRGSSLLYVADAQGQGGHAGRGRQGDLGLRHQPPQARRAARAAGGGRRHPGEPGAGAAALRAGQGQQAPHLRRPPAQARAHDREAGRERAIAAGAGTP